MRTAKSFSSAALVTASLALASACSKSPAPDAESVPTSAATTQGAAAKASVAADSSGVPECDAYTKKYEECLARSKAPAAGAAAAFKAQRDSFRLAAATVDGKAAIATTCKSLLDKLANDPICAK